jgi:histidinol-phosphate aminotransferase
MVGQSAVSGTHGGPDAAGVPRWDFSTNANACGPAPGVLRAVQQADVTRYPDPNYAALRVQLAAFHTVSADRIVIAASASEFILRMTAAVARLWPGASVHAPQPGYADYARAAQAFSLRQVNMAGDALLSWHTEPGSPDGASRRPPTTREGAVQVVDRAYEPLRLDGERSVLPSRAWQLMSPNKALGLTGVRGAYAIAPLESEALCATLDALAPSWPVGAQGVAMLSSWVTGETQAWLADCLPVLREWKRQQLALCAELGWVCLDSVTPFYLMQWPDIHLLPRLRTLGVKLRDTSTMGLPGHVRLSVQSPQAQHALRDAWREMSA